MSKQENIPRSDALRPDVSDGREEESAVPVFIVTLLVMPDRQTRIQFHPQFPPNAHLHDLAHVLGDTQTWLEQMRLSQTVHEVMAQVGQASRVLLPPGGLDFPLGRV